MPGQSGPDLTPNKQQNAVGKVSGFLCSAEEDWTSDICDGSPRQGKSGPGFFRINLHQPPDDD